jgi:two-component system cell cycle sensor histidine kinase/response regulator CckA
MGSSQHAKPHTILVVDDNEHIRTIERRYLESFGYDVMDAGDAAEAIGLISSGCPVDLVVTDLRMPEIGGEEMVARIRVTHPGLKVLYVSGKRDAVLDGHMLADTEGFLGKPFDGSQLAEAVSSLLFGAPPKPPPSSRS